MNDTQKLYVKADTPTPVTPKGVDSFIAMSIVDVLRTLFVGVIVGVVSMGLFYALNQYIFSAALCRAGVEGCSNAPVYSGIIATLVGVIVGIIALAKAGIYRPLPAAIAVGVAMWGVYGLMGNIAWYWGLLVGTVLFALAYMLFAWLSRIRSFIVSMIVLIVIVVVVRLVIG